MWGDGDATANKIDTVSTLTCYRIEFGEFLAHKVKSEESKRVIKA